MSRNKRETFELESLLDNGIHLDALVLHNEGYTHARIGKKNYYIKCIGGEDGFAMVYMQEGNFYVPHAAYKVVARYDKAKVIKTQFGV